MADSNQINITIKTPKEKENVFVNGEGTIKDVFNHIYILIIKSKIKFFFFLSYVTKLPKNLRKQLIKFV